MSKIKKYLPNILWGLVFLALGAVFLKVYLWEQAYETRMEQSERIDPYSNTRGANAVSEEEVTEQAIAEHIVGPEDPRYLSIPELGVHNARVIAVGTKANDQLDTPVNIFDVGWFNRSARPGSGGTILMDGHNGGPSKAGVFKRLPQLTQDAIITIERGDGTIFNYRVVQNETIPLDQSDDYMQKAQTSPIPGQESLSLITCTGEWNQNEQTYNSRQFVRAVLVQE